MNKVVLASVAYNSSGEHEGRMADGVYKIYHRSVASEVFRHINSTFAFFIGFGCSEIGHGIAHCAEYRGLCTAEAVNALLYIPDRKSASDL